MSSLSLREDQFTVYRNNGNNPTIVKLAGLRTKSGQAVEFEVTDKKEARIPEKEAIERFISAYLSGKYKKLSDGGQLVLGNDGIFVIAYKSKTQEQDTGMILNPNKLKQKDKGRRVYASNKTWNFDATKIEGILEDFNPSDDQPFYVSHGGEMKGYVAIEFAPEPELTPFDFSDDAVRAKLRGRWIRTKSGTNRKEMMITQFQFDTRWVIGTNITANTLMSDWEFLDGTSCGEYELVVKED